MSFVRAYLRCSTTDQDPNRARGQLQAFADERGLKIAAWYIETYSGNKLDRPELLRLLSDAHEGDVLLIEGTDRLTRLNQADWATLKREIDAKGIRIVSLDLPTSWQSVSTTDEVTARILGAMNSMLLDVLAAVAYKDYEQRRERQKQGIAKAKEAGKFKGKQANLERHKRIAGMLDKGLSWSDIQAATGCSRSTIKRVKDAQQSEALN